MEARELFTEIEAFVRRTRDEAMTKPGINSPGYTCLMGASSSYRDPAPIGSCSVYFSEGDYFTVEIVKYEEAYFKANISRGVVGFDSRSGLAYEEHKEAILSIWERAMRRTTLSLYEQELEKLIVQRCAKQTELKALDHKIGEHKKKMHQATNGGN